MSLNKLSLSENYDVIYKLFLPRESLVCDIPAGDGNIKKLFYGVYSPAYLTRPRIGLGFETLKRMKVYCISFFLPL